MEEGLKQRSDAETVALELTEAWEQAAQPPLSDLSVQAQATAQVQGPGCGHGGKWGCPGLREKRSRGTGFR